MNENFLQDTTIKIVFAHVPLKLATIKWVLKNKLEIMCEKLVSNKRAEE